MKKTNRSQVRQSGRRAKVFKNEANLGSARLRAIPFALALVFGSASSFADPMGGEVVAGQATISAMSGVTTIQQTSDRAIVNWQSFNVNAGEEVKFVQPSTAAILNRVVGGSVSNIDGLVNGNGRVYLINPNGIVVGANGVVNVNGGFVASTRDVSTDDFIKGGALVFTGESTGSIQVLGKVQSALGDVILIAPKIAIEKTAELIAGQSIKLVAANEVELSNGKLTVKPKAQDAGQITVEGALHAAKVQLAANNNNLGALAINTSGNIHATGTQTNPDGSISIIATGEGGSINISGNIRSEKGDGHGGAVTILADNGIRIKGTINANTSVGANINKAGGDIYIGRDITTNKLARATDVSGATLLSNKGFVETSGSFLKVDDISVKANDWLLDPTNIRIVTTVPTAAQLTPSDGPKSTGETQTFKDTNTAVVESRIQNTTINTALNNGVNVIISTGLRGPSGDVGTQDGNIIVDANGANSTITKNSGGNAKLTLIANNSIMLNGGISGTSTAGTLDIEMTAHGNPVNPANSQGITVNRAITTNGDITLTATINNPSTNTEAIRFNNTAITARKYTIVGTHNNTATASHGVVFNGTNTFTATEDSSIRGVTRGGSWPPSMGVYYLNGSNTTFNSGNGRTSVVGVLTGSGATGTRVSFDSGANITTNSSGTGSVTLGSNETGASFFHRRGTIRAATGTLNILGTSITTYEPNAIIQGDNGSTINLRANSIEFGTSAGGSSVIRPSAANGGFNLIIATDRLVVLAGSTTSSGTGTTTIQGFSNVTQIDLGGTDATGKLGITNAELNSFTARNLVVGNSTNTGGITVSGPITTLASTGTITLRTGGSIALNDALTVGFIPPQTPPISTLTLDAGGAITSNSDGKLIATGLVMNAGTTIGTSGSGAIKTAVNHASLSSGGAQFLVEDNAVTISAKTTGNGNINITTTNGTMTVGSVNGVSGIDAGTGNVNLKATSGLSHGIDMPSNVKGKDITVDAKANNATGLGFYGSGGSFTASGTLNLTGAATGTGNGFYSFGGTHTAQTGINITGTSANGQGVGFDRNVVLTNASNDIVITGTSNGTGANPEAIGLRGSGITNTNGNIKLVAAKGNVFTNSEGGTPGQYWGLPGPLTNTITNNGIGEIQILAGTTATDNGAIDGKVLTINQKGNGGVLVKTAGTGNVIAPKITNAGTGNVVIAAGSLKDAGDGSGGQVLTSSSSSVTQTSNGKTFIYTGKAADTGMLSNLDSTLGALKIDGTANQNADTNASFGAGSGISGSNAKAQVIFREKLTFGSNSLSNATLVKIYGDSSTQGSVLNSMLLNDAKGALKDVNNSTIIIGTDNNNIEVSKSAIIDSLMGEFTGGVISGAGYLKADTPTYQFSGLNSLQYKLATGVDVVVNVEKRVVSLQNINDIQNFTGALLTQRVPSFNTNDIKAGDDISINPLSLASGSAVGSYINALQLTGVDVENYELSAKGQLTIQYSVNPPTQLQRYVPIVSDIVNLAPVSFAVGVAPATAAGNEADPNICYAWGQRNGGDMVVHTVLKATYLGLRTAKTDTQEAMSNSGGSSSHPANPCGNDAATNVADAGKL